MPMVELGCDQEIPDRAEGEADIAVDDDSLEGGEGHVEVKCGFIHTQQIKRDHDHGAFGENLDEMSPGTGEPVEVFDGMVDGVDGPEDFELMVKAMLPVQDKIGAQDHDNKLKPNRGAANGFLQ